MSFLTIYTKHYESKVLSMGGRVNFSKLLISVHKEICVRLVWNCIPIIKLCYISFNLMYYYHFVDLDFRGLSESGDNGKNVSNYYQINCNITLAFNK